MDWVIHVGSVVRWLLIAALTIYGLVVLYFLIDVFRVRRHTARLIGGIPLGTLNRLWEIQGNRVGRYGSSSRPGWSPGRIVAVFGLLGLAACISGWIFHSPVLLLLASGLWLSVLHHAFATATPPTVLYLAGSSFESHVAQWKIQRALDAIGSYRVVSMLDTSVLVPTRERIPGWVEDELYKMTFRMRGDLTDDDWFAAIWWLMEVVPFIVVNLAGYSDETSREVEMVFSRDLASKMLFIVDSDETATPMLQTYRRRFASEPWRFRSQKELIDNLCALLRTTRRSGIVPELQARPIAPGERSRWSSDTSFFH